MNVAATAIVFALCNFPLPIGHDAALGQTPASPFERIVGGAFSYIVRRGDSLTSVSARFGVDVEVLASNNGLSSRAWLREGQMTVIDNRHIIPNVLPDGILINIPQRMLYFFKHGKMSRACPVGLGRPDWPTPTGSFTVISREENPVWDVPKSIQEEMRREGQIVQEHMPPCPENPLGRHWMGLSIPGFGIHGTIAPTSIYRFQTHGCIRLHPDDIAVLFEEVSQGATVRSIYQRVIAAHNGGRVFLEVHRDIYRKQRDALETLRRTALEENFASLVDWEKAKEIIAKQEGIARDITKQGATRRERGSTETPSSSGREP